MASNKIEIAEEDHVAVICEGSAEAAIIRMLLDGNLLIFNEQQLLDGQIFGNKYFTNAKRFQSEFLGLDFNPNHLVLLLIQDRKTKYSISPEYQPKISQQIYIITAPEIEMLIIHGLNVRKEYEKVKNSKKPCIFLAEYYKSSKESFKKTGFVQEFFKKHDLVQAIKEHKRVSSLEKGYFFLADLLNNNEKNS